MSPLNSRPLRTFSFTATALAAIVSFAVQAAPREPVVREAVVTMPAGQVNVSQARSAPDFVNARPVLLQAGPMPAQAYDFNAAAATGRAAPAAAAPAQPAALVDGADQAVQLVARNLLQSVTADGGILDAPNAVGSQGLQFTTSQVGPAAADTSFPFRATGKLWFEQVPGSGAWYVCSGSMIKPGVVVTAGHCVASGTGRWYGSFQFVPAYRSGSAPYGIWKSWASASTTSTWFSGGGGVPNAADYAVIVFNRNASGYRIGDYTGYLGWQYPSLIGKHVSVLGYPQNLDGGAINHRIDAQTTTGSNNTGLWGSDMRGGSSGGGVVLNLGYAYSTNTALPSDSAGNRLVSVVSYGPTADGPMYQGGSVFDSRFSTMLTNVCSSYAWAC